MTTNRVFTCYILLLALLSLSACSTLGGDEDETRSWSASKLYAEAKSSLDSGNFDQAIKYFETLEARYPFGRFAQQAQLEIAYAYYKFGEPDSTITAADRFIKMNPKHPYVAYAYYLKGLANFDRGASFLDKLMPRDPAEMDSAPAITAYNDFGVIVKRYPNSPYAADAKKRQLYLRNVLAKAELSVADYYMRRGAYLAAANRSKYLIEHFPGAKPVPKALLTLAQAYDKLGLPDLAQDTRRVLALNYPELSTPKP